MVVEIQVEVDREGADCWVAGGGRCVIRGLCAGCSGGCSAGGCSGKLFIGLLQGAVAGGAVEGADGLVKKGEALGWWVWWIGGVGEKRSGTHALSSTAGCIKACTCPGKKTHQLKSKDAAAWGLPPPWQQPQRRQAPDPGQPDPVAAGSLQDAAPRVVRRRRRRARELARGEATPVFDGTWGPAACGCMVGADWAGGEGGIGRGIGGCSSSSGASISSSGRGGAAALDLQLARSLGATAFGRLQRS